MELLRHIIDGIGDPVFVKDSRHRWVECNAAFCTLMDREREALLGRSERDLLPEDVAEVAWAEDEEVLRTGKERILESASTDEHGVTRVSVTKRWSFRGPDGEPYVVGIIQAPRQTPVPATGSKLSQKLAASAKFAMLGEMAAGIAHEINTPLAIIQASADELIDYIADETPDPNVLMGIHGRIDGTVAQVSWIIGGLRTLAHDADAEDTREVRLADVVADTLALCTESLRSRGIELRHEPRTMDVVVVCRPTQVVHALLNVLNNARDAVDGHDGERWIELRVEQGPRFVDLQVLDSGPGVPADIRPRIMDPFFTTKSAGSGTGIGLSVAQGLLAENGGQLHLDEGCESTCFVLRLPRASTAQRAHG